MSPTNEPVEFSRKKIPLTSYSALLNRHLEKLRGGKFAVTVHFRGLLSFHIFLPAYRSSNTKLRKIYRVLFAFKYRIAIISDKRETKLTPGLNTR